MKIPTRFRPLLAGLLGAIFLAFPAVIFASPAAAACIGGEPFTGFSPSSPEATGDGPFVAGEQRSVPDWYGYDRTPGLTEWYVENRDGVINPTGAKCSTNLDSIVTWDRFADDLNRFNAWIVGIPNSLLSAVDSVTEWMLGVQETVKNFINSGPYQELYTVLLWAFLPFAIITTAAIVFLQDSRSRASAIKSLAGDQRYQRKSAAWKEIGWVLASVALFGAIASGGLYSVQNFVTTTANGFSTVVTGAFANFASTADEFSTAEQGRVSPDICQTNKDTSGSWATSTAATTDLISCHLYRIYLWTPWVAQQFGDTDVNKFVIDKDNVYDNNADLQKAISQVEEKFGSDAAGLAPYLQMHIASGNNNEAFGQTEMTPEERYSAFDALGNTIDSNAISQEWAQDWGNGSGRFFDSLSATIWALIAIFPISIVLFVWLGALVASALLPMLAGVLAALLIVPQFRKRAAKVMKWWLYSLVVPIVASFSLAVSLTAGMVITNLLSFSGFGLFLFLAFSTFAYVFVLVWLWRALAKRGKKDDGPGLKEKVASTAGTAIGAAVGGGIGAGIGAQVGAAAAGANSEPRPGDTGSTAPELEASPQPRPPAPDDEIVDAEVVYDSAWEDYGPQAVPVAVPLAAPSAPTPTASIAAAPAARLTEDLGDDNPSDPTDPMGSPSSGGNSARDEQRIQDIIDEGVARIQATTDSSADYIADGTRRAAEALGQVTDAGSQVIQGEATRVQDEIAKSSEAVAEAARSVQTQTEGAARTIRGFEDGASRTIKDSVDSAASDAARDVRDEGRRQVADAAEAVDTRAEEAADRAETTVNNVADRRADSLDRQAEEAEERVRTEADEAEGRLIRRNT